VAFEWDDDDPDYEPEWEPSPKQLREAARAQDPGYVNPGRRLVRDVQRAWREDTKDGLGGLVALVFGIPLGIFMCVVVWEVLFRLFG